MDLLVPKTCSYDCIFCEVGRTTRRTLERREYAPVAELVAELTSWVKAGGQADYITVAGSGEPTLHSRFGDILDAIRRLGPIPSALLTNGSLLHLPEVRAAAAKADLVKASLSAWDETSFAAINRPDPGLTFKQLVGGLQQFRKEFKGKFWMEVVVVSGVNDDPAGIKKIAEWMARIAPDRIHLNTVVRPPAVSSVRAVSRDQLETWRGLFNPPAEIMASFEPRACQSAEIRDTDIVAMLDRRPCTRKDMAAAFSVAEEELQGRLETLLECGTLRKEQRGPEIYYLTSRR